MGEEDTDLFHLSPLAHSATLTQRPSMFLEGWDSGQGSRDKMGLVLATTGEPMSACLRRGHSKGLTETLGHLLPQETLSS